ncbi:hypothetical protein Dimus_028758 [Dionaea muscipula]
MLYAYMQKTIAVFDNHNLPPPQWQYLELEQHIPQDYELDSNNNSALQIATRLSFIDKTHVLRGEIYSFTEASKSFKEESKSVSKRYSIKIVVSSQGRSHI